jgi:DNA-binding CsgD family transcriptional regulator
VTHKLSDFITLRQLHRLELYTDLYQPFGIEHVLVVGLPATLRHTKCFLFHSQRRDFDERDRALLDALRPHFPALYTAAATRRVATAIASSEDASGEIVVLSPARAIDFETAAARTLLAHYFDDRRNGRLPEAVDSWVRQQTSRLNGQDSLPSPAEPLVVTREGRRLIVRLLGHTLLLVESPANLTRREREIIDLVAKGCSNAEIAAALTIAPTTVRKHLENIYAKLGVSNRTAAVAGYHPHRGTATPTATR